MNKIIQKTELLSPAGSIDAFNQALHNGADAIYMGGRAYGARAFAENFTNDDIKQCVEKAHLFGKKVYITANTLIHDSNVDEFIEYIKFLNNIGADAVILQDLGMATLIKSKFPDLTLHASTQFHNHSVSSLKFLEDISFSRAVFARECSLSEIYKPTNIEKEVFIHGALCISYSGQCLFSALTKQRSGNQGACAQNCRLKYDLLKKQDDNFVKQKAVGDFLLSPKDLGVLENLPKLLDANIHSLKIEGRMKSPEYVGYITRIYRKLIDDYYAGITSNISDTQQLNLSKLFNRGFTKGYAFDSFGAKMMGPKRPSHKGIKVGDIIKTTKDKIHIKLTDNLYQHDGIKFEDSDTGFVCEKIFKDGLLVKSANKGDTIMLENKDGLRKNEAVLKTKDRLLHNELAITKALKVPISIKIKAMLDHPVCISYESRGKTVSIQGSIVSKAKKAPISQEQIKQQISKLGNSPFICNEITCESDNDIFIAKSELNALRRDLCNMLILQLTKNKQVKEIEQIDYPTSNIEYDNNFGFTVFVRNNDQLKATNGFEFKRIYTDNKDLYNKNKSKITNLFFSIPRIFNEDEKFTGKNLLISDTAALYNNLNGKNNIHCDYFINAVNSYSIKKLNDLGVKSITISPEMSIEETDKMIKKYCSTFGINPNIEQIVYGKFELMLIKNCIIASTLQKNKFCDLCKKNDFYLSNLHKNIYPIKTHNNCVNSIFSACDSNISPSKIKSYKTIGINSFRISLLDEDYNKSINIFKMYFNSLFNA